MSPYLDNEIWYNPSIDMSLVNIYSTKIIDYLEDLFEINKGFIPIITTISNGNLQWDLQSWFREYIRKTLTFLLR